MTAVVAAESARSHARHARPHWERSRAVMSVKIPHFVNVLWDIAEHHPHATAACGLSLVAAAGLVWWPVAAVLAASAATALLVRGADRARLVSLADRLDDAVRDRELALAYGAATAKDLKVARAQLAAYEMASTATRRLAVLPAEDGGQ